MQGLGWVGGGGDPNKGVAGPNSVSAVFSFGLLGNGIYFCGATDKLEPNYQVGQNTFKNWAIYTNPVWNSLIYNIVCKTGNKECGSSNWWQTNLDQSKYALYTGKSYNSVPLGQKESVMVYPYGINKKEAYWVCAVGDEKEAGKCWYSSGTPLKPSQGGVKNTDYKGETVGNSIVFPF